MNSLQHNYPLSPIFHQMYAFLLLSCLLRLRYDGKRRNTHFGIHQLMNSWEAFPFRKFQPLAIECTCNALFPSLSVDSTKLIPLYYYARASLYNVCWSRRLVKIQHSNTDAFPMHLSWFNKIDEPIHSLWLHDFRLYDPIGIQGKMHTLRLVCFNHTLTYMSNSLPTRRVSYIYVRQICQLSL